MKKEIHEFKPIYDKNSKILILGSFPSVISRKNGFYYGNPRNRFWKVLSLILEENIPKTNEEKIEFLLRNKIAIYDAAISCEIRGSSDSSMKAIIPSDLKPILISSNIKKVFANGKKAYDIVKKKHLKSEEYNFELELLPSTSPANASYSVENLLESWSIIKDILK